MNYKGVFHIYTTPCHTILWPLILTMQRHINYHTAKHAFPLPIGWWTTASRYLGSVFISASTQMMYSSTPTRPEEKGTWPGFADVWSQKKFCSRWIGFPAMAVSVAAAALNEPTEASATCTSLKSRQALHKLAIRISSGISINRDFTHRVLKLHISLVLEFT